MFTYRLDSVFVEKIVHAGFGSIGPRWRCQLPTFPFSLYRRWSGPYLSETPCEYSGQLPKAMQQAPPISKRNPLQPSRLDPRSICVPYFPIPNPTSSLIETLGYLWFTSHSRVTWISITLVNGAGEFLATCSPRTIISISHVFSVCVKIQTAVTSKKNVIFLLNFSIDFKFRTRPLFFVHSTGKSQAKGFGQKRLKWH